MTRQFTMTQLVWSVPSCSCSMGAFIRNHSSPNSSALSQCQPWNICSCSWSNQSLNVVMLLSFAQNHTKSQLPCSAIPGGSLHAIGQSAIAVNLNAFAQNQVVQVVTLLFSHPWCVSPCYRSVRYCSEPQCLCTKPSGTSRDSPVQPSLV